MTLLSRGARGGACREQKIGFLWFTGSGELWCRGVEPVARQAIAYLKAKAPQWLARLTVHEGQRVRHRFWQPGGGYDRNITSTEALRAMIDYIHANPVRRGLVARVEHWEWSSARWYAGIQPVRIEMDSQVLVELAR